MSSSSINLFSPSGNFQRTSQPSKADKSNPVASAVVKRVKFDGMSRSHASRNISEELFSPRFHALEPDTNQSPPQRSSAPQPQEVSECKGEIEHTTIGSKQPDTKPSKKRSSEVFTFAVKAVLASTPLNKFKDNSYLENDSPSYTGELAREIISRRDVRHAGNSDYERDCVIF